jgi:hypothetical protein
LLATGARVEVVTGAVKELNRDNRDRFFDEFRAQGGVLTTISAVRGERHA